MSLRGQRGKHEFSALYVRRTLVVTWCKGGGGGERGSLGSNMNFSRARLKGWLLPFHCSSPWFDCCSTLRVHPPEHFLNDSGQPRTASENKGALRPLRLPLFSSQGSPRSNRTTRGPGVLCLRSVLFLPFLFPPSLASHSSTTSKHLLLSASPPLSYQVQ